MPHRTIDVAETRGACRRNDAARLARQRKVESIARDPTLAAQRDELSIGNVNPGTGRTTSVDDR